MSLTSQRPSRVKKLRSDLMADVSGNVERKRRLNADIEETLYRRLKVRAAEEGRTVSEITRVLWLEYLSKNSK